LAGQLPVLRLIAQEVSSRISGPVRASAYEARPDAAARVSGQPRWAWDTTFLGSLTAALRKELVGVTPDGFRINWHVKTGSFVGPGLDAVVLPGAADWMRIRRDGVAIVNVQACFETRDGARVYGSYGGIFDLGPDGYARALRDEYDRLPPVVVTPAYATADPRLQWLNRAQCVGVGRVDMSALRVEFDVYVVRVGDRIYDGNTIARSDTSLPASLYTRVGGQDAMVAITEDFVAAVLADRQLARFFPNASAQPGLKELKDRVAELLCEITGGPCIYRGRDMKTAHKGMGITETDWTIAVDLFTAALIKRNVEPREQSEFVQIIEDMKSQIVEAS
jgi:truncated hemoglobin YjbI